MRHIRILFLLFIAAVFASCNQGGVDNTLNSGVESAGAWIVPSVGTSYVYSDSVESPNGSVDGSSLEGFDTATVLRTGQFFGGKSNVIELFDQNEGGLQFYNYESNGDISEDDSNTTDSAGRIVKTLAWDTYPTGRKQTIVVNPAVDTIEDGERFISSDVREFIGTENITTPAGNFITLHIRETSINDGVAPNNSSGTFTDTSSYDVWFAPSIGYFVKVTDRDINNGSLLGGYECNLIKYTPN